MSEIPIKAFATLEDWEKWLSRHHADAEGIWLRLYKKDSGIKTVSRMDALDVALCYGWIDGQSNKDGDDQSWLQKFTPRRPKSLWSKRNREHIARLEKAGRMKPAGLLEVEKAKADGRWEKAYDSPSNMEMPDDFMKKLSKNKKALTFFNTLNKANKYAIGWRLQTAKKPETREKRMKVILEMLSEGEKFH